MEFIDCTTATIIANRFGLANNDIAQASGLMGPSHIFNDQCGIHVLRLILFSRMQTTNGQVTQTTFKTKERFPKEEQILSSNPEFIFGCWCGKPVDINSIKSRKGWENLDAVKNNKVFELEPEVFLQPGPALFESGIELIAITRRNLNVKFLGVIYYVFNTGSKQLMIIYNADRNFSTHGFV